MTHRSGPPRARGFTLIEMLFVVAIAAILLAIGVPELREFVADQRVRTVASDLAQEFAYARAQAIQDSRRVYIERTNPLWKDGWRIYVDRNSNGSYDAGEEIKINLGLSGSPNLRVCSTAGDFATNVILRPDGRIVRVSAPASSDGIYVVDDLGDGDPLNNKIRGLMFGTTGRITIVNFNKTIPPC